MSTYEGLIQNRSFTDEEYINLTEVQGWHVDRPYYFHTEILLSLVEAQKLLCLRSLNNMKRCFETAELGSLHCYLHIVPY